MRYKTLAVAVVAALVVLTGAAAATPGNADGTGDEGDAGPPGTLPGPVPDFVSDLHETIQSFLDGALDGSLGDAISEIAGGSPAAPGAAGGQ